MNDRHVRILGTRGVPAAHGGFETFAENLAHYLVAHGWRVTVYCQVDGEGEITEDRWQGIDRVHIPIAIDGPKGTMAFDWQSIKHAARSKDLCLTLGYNTAFFCAWLRLRGVPNLINMDGIEWKRQKWGTIAKVWFYLNEIAGCWLGNHLIADHPGIKKHLERVVAGQKITMIPYGADAVRDADSTVLSQYGLSPDQYGILIARPEPENSILEVVQAYSARPKTMPLVVLGNYTPDKSAYHKAVLAAASNDVHFVGAIYDKATVNALRAYSRFYVHGHQVGGTNPSLVEALGAGSPVLAHDNLFNRWVAADSAVYFSGSDGCAAQLDALTSDDELIARLREQARANHQSRFTWQQILAEYEQLLLEWLPRAESVQGFNTPIGK